MTFLAAVTTGTKAKDELSVDERIDHERGLPFDPCHGLSREEAGRDPRYSAFFTRYYLGKKGGQDEKANWRQIEDDWLGAADGLALKLDSDTNNTSLVLAIELGEGGPGSAVPR